MLPRGDSLIPQARKFCSCTRTRNIQSYQIGYKLLTDVTLRKIKEKVCHRFRNLCYLSDMVYTFSYKVHSKARDSAIFRTRRLLEKSVLCLEPAENVSLGYFNVTFDMALGARLPRWFEKALYHCKYLEYCQLIAKCCSVCDNACVVIAPSLCLIQQRRGGAITL